ncbi:protein mono-ADP-ribosyltransferase PARP14-like isoform X2 [Littorina saxatilis]|uniref:protein mono-ADP-ribosyltransferase PARP14-like isoform X2 n=1 Tax=Littorina saxatilis TaxID=31220 RepID=UPI0038B62ED0
MDSDSFDDFSLLNQSIEDTGGDAANKPTQSDKTFTSTCTVPPHAQLHIELQQSQPLESSADPGEEHSLMDEADSPVAAGTDETPESSQSAKEESSNLASIFSGITSISSEPLEPRGYREERTDYVYTDPPEEGVAQGTHHIDEDSSKEKEEGQKLAAENDGESSDEGRSRSGVAVQRGEGGRVVLKFKTQAADGQAGEESSTDNDGRQAGDAPTEPLAREGSPKSKREKMSGILSVSDRIRQLEQAKNNSTPAVPLAGSQRLIQPASPSQQKKQLKPPGLEDTSQTLSPNTAEKQQPLDERSKAEDDSRLLIAEAMEPCATPTEATDSTGKKEVEEEEEDEFINISRSDEGDQFSTPNGSPTFGQPAPSQPFSKSPHVAGQQQGFLHTQGQGSPVGNAPGSSPRPRMPMETPGNAGGQQRMMSSEDHQRSMSPRPIVDPERRHSMQGPESTGSAFRPVAMRPLQMWMSQQNIQGYGSPQYPSPPYQQQLYSSPPPQQGTPSPGMQQSFDQARSSPSGSYPDPSWQGGHHYPYQQGGHYQQQLYQQQGWQQQQQGYASYQQNQHHQQAGHPSLSPEGVRGQSLGEPAGLHTPPRASGGGSPHFAGGSGQPRSTGGHPSSYTPQSSGEDDTSKGPSTPCTVRVNGVNSDVNLELLEFYFESPKSGGGSVTNVTDHREEGYVLVTFEDPAVVERVLQRPHTVSKKTLILSVHDEHAQQPEEQHTEDTEDFSCTVEVSGAGDTVDEEMMELYFESTKKSGGGKIKKVEVLEDRGVTLITFEDKKAAEAVVQKGEHVAYGTKLTVVPYRPPGPSAKVKVSGLTSKASEELLQLYFERTGDVKEVQLDSEKGEAVITFTDPEDAQAALQKSHKISGKPVTLSLVTSTPSPPVTKVNVSGLTSKASEELLQLYFERTAVVQDVQLDAEKGKAVVTFANPEDVKAVLEKEHKISGKKVTVSLWTPSATSKDAKDTKPVPELSSSLKVEGLALNTSEETISYYFENKRRSGGGPVKDVQYSEGSGVAIITFEEADTAKQVLKKKHTIDGSPLKLRLYSQPSPQVQDDPRSEESKGLNTISVRGLTSTTSTDTLTNYFENKRRSGGGNVENVRLDSKKEVFFVTFEDPQDAANVAERQHKLDGQTLEVSLYKPPEMCKDRILLRNLPEVKSADELVNFVEVKSGLTVNKVLFADEEGTAVVIFEDDIDRQKVQTALTKKQFKQRKLTVDSIPVSCTVLVNGLPVNQHVSEDTLTNYFENTKRSGGGDVWGVEMFINEQYALVTFDKPDVAARVAGKQHKIQSQPVNVNMYMECLGVGGGSEEPTAKIPQPLPISVEELHKISLLDLLPSLKELFLTSLGNQYACLEINLNIPGSSSIVCTLTPDTEGCREKAKSWAEGVQGLLQDFLPAVFVQEMDVTEDEFAETQNILDEMIAGKPDVGFGYVANKNRLTIAYKGEEQKELVDNLVFKVGEVQQDLQRKKKETQAKMEFTRGQQRLLKKHKAIKDIPRMYPQLGIAYFEEGGYVELKGLPEETQAAKLAYLETSGVMTSLTRRWESPLHSKLLESAAAKKIVESLCLQEGPEDEVEFGPDGFHVYSFDAERAEVVQMTALKAVQRRVLKFDEASKEVLMTEEWKTQKESIMERNKDKMLMEEDSSSLTIVSVSDSRSVQKDYKALQDFIQENSMQEHPFPLPHAMHKLFKAYMQQKAYDIHLQVEDFEFDSNNDQIVAKGNSMYLDAARQIYSSFRETLTERHKTYTQPSMKNFFSMSQWMAKREEIEHELKCLVLDPNDIPEGFMGWEDAAVRSPSPLQGYHAHDVFAEEFGSRSTFEETAALWEAIAMPSTAGEPKQRGNTRGKQKRDSAAAERPPGQPKPDLPARPRLYLSVMSDITKEEHHVLVNSSNPTLNMSNGQVSSALLKVGGPEIQQELASTYPQGITIGDVAVSSGGKLMCKKLFHCCLPEQKVQADQEMRQVVRDAVTKCMAEADKLGMGSIGFPSLGTGNLNYPAPLVCNTMFEAALDYGRQHPDTAISDVFFILHKKDENLTKVFREEEATYKQMLRDSKKVETEEETEAAPANPSAQGVKAHLFFQETQGKVRKLIIGVDPSAVDRAEKEILACYKDCISKLTSDVQHLEQWDDLHIQTLIHACKAAELDITFNFSLGHLELQGFRDNLGKIPLHQTIKEAEAVITEKYNAQLVAKQVQWSCIEIAEDGEHLLGYEMLNNYRIETSYQAGQDKVMILDKGSAYIIIFSKMEEIPEDPGDDSPPVRVIRQNKINTLNVEPPREWSDMRGQDLDVVPLQAGSQEYAGQADIFLQSLGKPNARIIKIERVQNLTLYKQYSAMKSQMESTMANDRPCERPNLWHGTREEAVQGIIKYGFNRSYSDLKMSPFGQGAYFAATAEYSSRNQYAVASQNGDRNMFLCRVLVGQFTVGTADMRIPPEITAGGQRYNSTVNDAKTPDIFVTYSDVQAYPEYRILFNDQ